MERVAYALALVFLAVALAGVGLVVWASWQSADIPRLAGILVGAGSVLGTAFALWHRHLKLTGSLVALSPERQPPPKAERRIAGLPQISESEELKQLFIRLWPVLTLALASGLLIRPLTTILVEAGVGWEALMWGMAMANVGIVGLLFWSLRREKQRLQEDPAREEAFSNRLAHRLLERPELFWPQREENEVPRETLVLSSARGYQWLVLTNQRLLVFRVQDLREGLQTAWPRSAVRAVRVRELARSRSLIERLRAFFTPSLVRLTIRLRGGRVEGVASSAHAARRLAAVLGGVASARQEHPISKSGQV